jgi:DNA-directed RNA polymerase subunit RPC12/RpoP
MTGNTRNGKLDADARLLVTKRLVRGSAVVFGAAGLVMLYGARDYIPPLAQPDPVTGLTTRALLCVAGLVHLAICAWLCVTRDPTTLGLIGCWAALNYAVYLGGAAWLKTAGAIPAVVVLAWELGVSSKVIYGVWGVLNAYLVVSGLLVLLLERRRRMRLEAEAFLKGWGQLRHAPAPPAPGGRASARAQTSSESSGGQGSRGRSPSQVGSTEEALPADFKFSCPLCGQHIRYEARYSGRTIACPACREKIVVPDANQDAPHGRDATSDTN